MARIPIPPGTDALDLHLVKRGSRTEDYPDLGPETRSGALGEAYKQKNRGRSQELAVATAQPIDLISVNGDDQLARQLTVTCQVTPKEVQGVNFPPVVGTLSWGNDGFQAQADFDFLHGTQLTVAGAMLRLSARVDVDAPGVTPGEAIPAVRVGAHLSYLPPATSPIYRTRYAELDAAGGGAAAVLEIPRFAAFADVLRTDAGGAGAVLLEILDRLGATIASISSVGPIQQKLPNDGRSVRITNLSGAAMSSRLVFSLWL